MRVNPTEKDLLLLRDPFATSIVSPSYKMPDLTSQTYRDRTARKTAIAFGLRSGSLVLYWLAMDKRAAAIAPEHNHEHPMFNPHQVPPTVRDS
ncbi:hypothetical protein KR51_00025730 [Rubidibacter lacunae KORDI 51-2]|uniref:Uncharacterized protein n=1 Tax=Rubidibacter lacunae KORDI 51-2 TaxID=582515 RepID=U5DIV0_9CHRO|nr:hypothetical protein KR51_00025730 [Rubidibacter lacunae KORDI 51-2]